MKAFILVAVLVAICTVCADEIIDRQWEYYKTKFNKVYNAEEEVFRKGLFVAKFYSIVEHNRRYDAGEENFRLGYTKFTDWTQEEFAKLFHPLYPSEQ